MASNIHGFLNENIISSYLNEKSLVMLNDNMKKFVSWLFDYKVGDNDMICSGSIKKPAGERKNPKPDIWIKINNITKNISLKEGFGNSVHQEPLAGFCDFLKTLDVEQKVIDFLKLYHFGDDTIDSTGEIRYSTAQIKNSYKEQIRNVNEVLNATNILYKILNRVLFFGTLKTPVIVDACYHGDVDNGLWASREEILQFLSTNSSSNLSGVMFSSLTYQPWTRDTKKTASHPQRRFVSQIKWGSMKTDLIRITNGRTNG